MQEPRPPFVIERYGRLTEMDRSFDIGCAPLATQDEREQYLGIGRARRVDTFRLRPDPDVAICR